MIHVYPIDEEKEHNLDEDDSTCDCGTRLMLADDGEMIIVHDFFKDQEPFTDEEVNKLLADHRKSSSSL